MLCIVLSLGTTHTLFVLIFVIIAKCDHRPDQIASCYNVSQKYHSVPIVLTLVRSPVASPRAISLFEKRTEPVDWQRGATNIASHQTQSVQVTGVVYSGGVHWEVWTRTK